jgi:hypothetical protein
VTHLLVASMFLPVCLTDSYTIVGVSIGPVATFLRDFRPTLEYYLSEQVSKTVGRNISFKLTGVSLNAEKDTIFELVESKSVDFVYSAPNMLGCLDSEFDIKFLATMRKKYTIKGEEFILNRRGHFFHPLIRIKFDCHGSQVRWRHYYKVRRPLLLLNTSLE